MVSSNNDKVVHQAVIEHDFPLLILDQDNIGQDDIEGFQPALETSPYASLFPAKTWTTQRMWSLWPNPCTKRR